MAKAWPSLSTVWNRIFLEHRSLTGQSYNSRHHEVISYRSKQGNMCGYLRMLSFLITG